MPEIQALGITYLELFNPQPQTVGLDGFGGRGNRTAIGVFDGGNSDGVLAKAFVYAWEIDWTTVSEVLPHRNEASAEVIEWVFQSILEHSFLTESAQRKLAYAGRCAYMSAHSAEDIFAVSRLGFEHRFETRPDGKTNVNLIHPVHPLGIFQPGLHMLGIEEAVSFLPKKRLQ